MKRTIIIGDVHGCYSELETLISKVDFKPSQDRLIFVGDLINRGPNSRAVLEYVRSLGAESVIGNHELAFLSYLSNDKKNTSFDQVKASLGRDLKNWKDWIKNLPSYIDEKKFLVVHAGLPPGKNLKKCDRKTLATIRTWDGEGRDLNNPDNPPWYQFYKDSKLIVYGHWAKNGLTIRRNTIGLDSGCVYGGKLSALILPDRKVIQVPALAVHYDPTPLLS